MGRITKQEFNNNLKVEYEETVLKAKKNDEVLPSIDSIWEPPVMPDTLRGNGLVPTSYDPNVQLAAMMDPLLVGNSDYVKKRSLGKDQTATYDIWCYEFTPKNPEKTILLTSMIHGNEYTGFYWMAQFLDLVVRNPDNDPHLAYIRKNIKLVTVPIANPWGHMNQKRYNSNDVDCSRNFDYNWGQVFDEYPQGIAAWSEAESRAIRDLMAEIAPECSAALDFHTTLSEGKTHHILYFPRFLYNMVDNYIGLIEQMKKPGETTALASTVIPTLTNWGIYNHGFNSANPEFYNGLSGGTRSSAEMTRAMKFFGNFVMQAARMPGKNKFTTISKPDFTEISFDHRKNGGPITFATTSYTSQTTKTAVKFSPKNEGVFEVYGRITVSVTADAEVSIIPHLYQVKSPDFDFAKTTAADREEENAVIFNMKAGTEQVIPFQAAILCHKANILATDNTNDRAQEIVFQLRTKITAGTGSIKFVKALAKLTPNTSGDRFRRITTNPATLTYPISQGVTYGF